MGEAVMEIGSYVDPKEKKKFEEAIPRIRANWIAKTKWDDHHPNFGVGSNTLRAFGNYGLKPGEAYREWAARQCETIFGRDKEALGTLRKSLTSQQKFEEWHALIAKSLQIAWKHKQKKKGIDKAGGISIAHKYKLVDLFLKWLSRHDFGDNGAFARLLERYAHCALDKYTLEKINACLGGALPLKNPTMGHVHTENTYLYCQELIREYCRLTKDGTPLLFDFFAWNPKKK